MADQSWRELEGWQRLIWARRRANFETAKAAADSMGIKPGTYAGYERNPDSSRHVPLDHQNAARFAKKYRVRWEWLLMGEGKPWLETEEPDGEPPSPATRVVVALKTVSDERAAAIADAVEALVRAERK